MTFVIFFLSLLKFPVGFYWKIKTNQTNEEKDTGIREE